MEPDALGGCWQLFGSTESNRMDGGQASGQMTKNALYLECLFSKNTSTYFAKKNA